MFSPIRYGTKGCMPAEIKRVVGSFSGIKEALGKTAWFLDLKKSRNF